MSAVLRKQVALDGLTRTADKLTTSEIRRVERFAMAVRAQRTGASTLDASDWSDEVLPWLDLSMLTVDAIEALTFATLWLYQTRDIASHVGKGVEAREAEAVIDGFLEALLPLGDQGAVLAALRAGLADAMARSWSVPASESEADAST